MNSAIENITTRVGSQSPSTTAKGTQSASAQSETPQTEVQANERAPRVPIMREFEPLVPPPSLQIFELPPPSMTATFISLADPELTVPTGIKNMPELVSEETRSESRPSAKSVPSDGRELSINRASAVIAAPFGQSADVRTIDNAQEAEETASMTRDQIRYEPRTALAAQANSSPANVLAMLS